MLLSRRQFATSCTAGIAFAGLAAAASAAQDDSGYRNEVRGYGPLAPDSRGLLDLPEGFSYQVISVGGETMDDGFLVPGKFDGMACFALGRDRLALVRNHELRPDDGELGPAGGLARLEQRLRQERHYDVGHDGRVLPGGTSTLIVDARSGRRELQYLSLVGTAVNCAGGPTPWGSWLSCEETELKAPDVPLSHGWVFDVPADRRGLADARPLKPLGRFRHEAVAVDPGTGILYQTEDRGDGLFTRFLPNDRRNLQAGGRLQALAFVDAPADTRNWQQADFVRGTTRPVRWIDLEGTDSPADDLRMRGAAAGAAVFARGEGIHAGEGEFYFTCTSGGARRLGQIMRYRPSRFEGQPGEQQEPGSLQLFLESGDRQLFEYGDNLTVAPWGHLVVCEDRSGDAINYLRGVTPAGQLYTIARLHAATELAGACFSPDGRILFLNVYQPGRTVAITGPWRSVA